MLDVRAAVHAMEEVFADEDTEAMILVDAFYCFNRQVALLNCGTVCPALSHILINTSSKNRNNSQLFFDGQCILSKEGTTQGTH
jgi:hypothetical protein